MFNKIFEEKALFSVVFIFVKSNIIMSSLWSLYYGMEWRIVLKIFLQKTRWQSSLFSVMFISALWTDSAVCLYFSASRKFHPNLMYYYYYYTVYEIHLMRRYYRSGHRHENNNNNTLKPSKGLHHYYRQLCDVVSIPLSYSGAQYGTMSGVSSLNDNVVVFVYLISYNLVIWFTLIVV